MNVLVKLKNMVKEWRASRRQPASKYAHRKWDY